jgi:shikimate dehydrogenase
LHSGITRQAGTRADTRRLYLIGHNISRSLSPEIHDAAFKKAGFNAKYLILDVGLSEFDSTVTRILAAKETLGFNITVPYKERIISYLTELHHVASEVGAVNTIKIKGAAIRGYNTDVDGIALSLRKLGFTGSNKDKAAIILGAGGAGRACVFAVLGNGFRRVTIMNRSEDRASAIARDFSGKFPRASIETVSLDPSNLSEAAAHHNLLVNAISDSTGDSFPISIDFSKAKRGLKCFDLNYKETTLLMKKAQASGIKTIGGLPMLVEQAAKSFEIWTGKVAPRRTMILAAMRARSVR